MTLKPELPEDSFTVYEKSRIIGSRALQISQGAPFLIDLTDDELKELNYNPIEIAKKEFEEGALPVGVDRTPAHKKHQSKLEEN